MKKYDDRKNLIFSHLCLVKGVEKWKGGKFFCLVREKKKRMENIIYMN